MNTKNQKTIKFNTKIITFLNHLELINECLSSDIYGEARYEIHKLEECIKNDLKIKSDIKALALSLCDVACSNMISRNNDKIAPCMFSLNQLAIKTVIHFLEEDSFNKSESIKVV